MSAGWDDLIKYFYAGEGQHNGDDGTVLDFVEIPYLPGTFGQGEAPTFNVMIEDTVHEPGPNYAKVNGPQRMSGMPMGGVDVDLDSGAMTFHPNKTVQSSTFGDATPIGFKGQPFIATPRGDSRPWLIDDIFAVPDDADLNAAGEVVNSFVPASTGGWTPLASLDEFGDFTQAPDDVLAFDPQGIGQPFIVYPVVTFEKDTGTPVILPYA